MKKFLGLLIIAFGIFLEVMWLGVCFGTVIIGILLLIFAPRILFFPFNLFLIIGLSVMNPVKYSRANSFKYQSYSNQGGSRNSQSSYASQSSMSAYYEALESSPSDELSVIKKNYRRLIKEYHYDSIASKDLPEDMVKFAQKKTQELNEAYAAIKEAKA